MNVLCVVAHPDDEVLGCGGTLAKHVDAGDSVTVVCLSSRSNELTSAFHKASEALGTRGAKDYLKGGCGASWVIGKLYGGEPPLEDQRFDQRPVALIADTIASWRIGGDPDMVYTHHPGDLNLDHALTARAVLTAFRPKPGENPRTILACEVPSSTEYTYPRVFQPNWYETLTLEQAKKKDDALARYPSEVQEGPHPRSTYGVWNQLRLRGQEVGVRHAEAFQLLRRSC